jgi:hypothetical protein
MKDKNKTVSVTQNIPESKLITKGVLYTFDLFCYKC